MTKKMPQNIKDSFYFEFCKPSNYKDLSIKKNAINNKLENIYNNNIWNLKEQSEQLSKKIEYKGIYNAFLNGVYLLDYKTKPKIKSIIKKDFFNYKYKGENTDRTELNYINVYKAWINNIFQEHSTDINLDWFIYNQNEVLLKLLEYRNINNLKLETIRKDINLLLKLLKIAVGERVEIVNKYKVLQMALSKMHENKEQNNELNEVEAQSFVPYKDLIRLRNKIYEEWNETYENTPLNKYKNPQLRIENIKALLLTFYICFPPSRNEALNLEIVNSEKEAKTKKAAIYIKDKNNIFIYYNDVKKNHQPIDFNLNDPVIKSYSKKHVDLLIETIIESLNDYPREYLFINSKNEPYTEKGLQKMLYDLLKDKNIGVNSLRSSYASYWVPKLNANQVQRVSFLMRTSAAMLYKNYLKKDEIKEEEPLQQTKINNEQKKEIIKFTPEQKEEYDNNRTEYYKKYYEKRKEELLNRAKINDKEKYYLRITRELNQNKKDFKKMKPETIEKYKIKYDDKTKKYISLLNSNH
jgi:hypothetical protein